jgi:hypothetical protein
MELFNRGTSAVDLTGWSVQYNSATLTTTWQVTPICPTGPCTVQPGQYFLVQEAQGAGGTTNLPTPDATGIIAMSATAAKVAVVNNTTALSGGCPTGGGIIDLVGYSSTASCSETSPTAGLSNTTADIRNSNGCTDTDNNSADFTIGSPIPRNTSSPANVCGTGGALSATGSANPSGPEPSDFTLLSVTVTPAAAPPSTGITVTGDLTSIGGSPTQTFYDDGTHGDATPADNVFSFLAQVSADTTTGAKSLPISVADGQARTAGTNISLSVTSPTCGVERWSVKTGTDPDAALVDVNTATPVTIADMRSWPAPSPTPPDNARVAPYERSVWVVNATLTVYKKETDVDYHVVVQDGANNTIITELPCSCCAVGSPFQTMIANARQIFDARLTATSSFQTANIPVRVTGVGFFDFIHGQTGVAPNGIELHPVLNIAFPTQQSAMTASGANVNTQAGDANITFSSVSSPGTTTVTPIDPSSAGAPPDSSYSLVGPGYDISTTATTSGPINICFSVPSITNPASFANLKVLHSEGGNLIDRTSGENFNSKIVCGSNIPSLSPFVIAVGLAPTAAPGHITGRIVTVGGLPVEGVTVTLSGTKSRKTITDANGLYSFTGVEAGGFYTVSASRANYSFSPAQRSFSLLGNTAEARFTASPMTPTANPLDSEEFFVRQQYLDFLDREPDQGGLEYWSDQLHQCNGDSACLRQKTNGVSAAFFMEREFQDTGFFVYRVYSAAFGTRPSYSEFNRERSLIVDGQYKEVNKSTYIDGFVERADFKQRYPSTLNNEQFVNQLFDASQLYFNVLDRQAYINALAAGATRADVVRGVIDLSQFKDREYDRAFVLMQYFGYLRRDPDEGGYQFWLNTLRSEPNNYAGMVCAFITSAEYQRRFSPVLTHSNSECQAVTLSVSAPQLKATVLAAADDDE